MNLNEIVSLVEDLTYRVRLLEQKVAALAAALCGKLGKKPCSRHAEGGARRLHPGKALL